MVDIEPYQYQKTTNVKEHNDIVAKINEIVDVLNNSGADTLGPRISKLETDVSALDSAVKIQYQDIASIRDKDQAQDTNIGTLDAQVKGISESLVSGVNVIDGTTTGKFKVRLDREKAPSINSNDYDLRKATSIELVQGSGPSMLKAQITLSDGTTLISDDFLFTTEAIGTDVYISSFVFKNGNVAGTISADIGLSNGSTLEANNFIVPMDPSLLNTVQDLSTRLTAVEGGSVAGFKELEAQVNTNKNNIATLTTEIDDLDIKKADQSNSNQEIIAGTITATNITKGGVDVATINDIGQGDVWELINLNNFPTDWADGDRIKISIKQAVLYNTSSLADIDNRIIVELMVWGGKTTAYVHATPFFIEPFWINGIQCEPIEGMNNGSRIFTIIYWKLDQSQTFNVLRITSNNLTSFVDKMWRLKK